MTLKLSFFLSLSLAPFLPPLSPSPSPLYSLGVDTSSHLSSSSLEGSPSPVRVGSELQQQHHRVSSPTTLHPVKYVYPHPTSSSSLAPYHRVNLGDGDDDESGYGCSGDGQGCLSYVPSSEALASE